MQSEMFTFKTFNSAPCTFNCSVEHPEFFTVPKTFAAPATTDWDGIENKMAIEFEPMELGECRDVLTITSPDGGEYVCDLIAVCIPPVPVGPFALIKGAAIDIPFRNCFTKVCDWSFTVDSPSFRVLSGSNSVQAKSSGTCNVVFEPIPEVITANPGGGTVTAKLFISCLSNPEIPPWIFYLKGKFEAGAVAAPPAAAGGAKKK